MKFNTEEKLIDYLGENKQRRKRELISIRQELISKGKSSPMHIKRAAILFSYAHWEGFVKDAARCYVAFVSYKSKPFNSLASNFQAIACRQQLLKAANATKRVAPHIELLNMITLEGDTSFALDATVAVNTESNLKFDVFKNICDSIGVLTKEWDVDRKFMDELYENRCSVAHGEFFTPEIEYCTEVLDFVLCWIEDFSTQIENKTVLKEYLRD